MWFRLARRVRVQLLPASEPAHWMLARALPRPDLARRGWAHPPAEDAEAVAMPPATGGAEQGRTDATNRENSAPLPLALVRAMSVVAAVASALEQLDLPRTATPKQK